jgi:hypothetical protein
MNIEAADCNGYYHHSEPGGIGHKQQRWTILCSAETVHGIESETASQSDFYYFHFKMRFVIIKVYLHVRPILH